MKRHDKIKARTQRRGKEPKVGAEEEVRNISYHVDGFIRLCVSLFFLLVLFVSCATAPKVSVSPENEGWEFSLLPAGGSVYLWADTVKGRPLLDVLSFEGKSGKDAGKILDSTSSAVAAVFPDGQSRRFYLAALGDYPRVKASFSFAFSSAWKKQKSRTGNSYWYSKNDNIALALGSSLALVSDMDPFEELPKGISPQGFTEFRQGLALAGWMSSPSGPINSFLNTLGIPLQIPAEELFFGAVRLPADNGQSPEKPWELVFRIRTPSATQARSLLSLFSIARFFLLSGAVQQGSVGEGLFPSGSMSPLEAAALLFANPPEQDGDTLIIHTGSLDEKGIALLFNMFSIYSN